MPTKQLVANLGDTVEFKHRHAPGMGQGVVIAVHPHGFRGSEKPAIQVYDPEANIVYHFHQDRGYKVIAAAPADPAARETKLEDVRERRRTYLRQIPAWRDRLDRDPAADVFEGA